MRRALNPQCIVYPTYERIRASATELGFQLKLTNIAVKFFSFFLNVVCRADLSWSDNLVVIDEKHRCSASLQQLLDLREFALLDLWRKTVIARLSNSVSFVSNHDVNHIYVRPHVAVEVTDLCCPTSANDLSNSRSECTRPCHVV